MKDPDKKERKHTGFHDFELRSLTDYLLMIRERWFIGLFCAVLASGAAGYYLLDRPPLYQSDASILMERQGERVLDMQQVVDTGMDGQVWHVLLQNHINQLNSRQFRDYVVQSFSEEEERRILEPYHSQNDAESPSSLHGAMGDVDIESVPNSFILEIRVSHLDPEAAALIADRFAEAYIEFMRERRQTGNAAAIGFLEEREEELRERVEKAEQALQAYRQEHNLVSVEENQNLIVQRLNEINRKLTDARLERLDLESRMQQVEAVREGEKDFLEISDLATLGATPDVVNELDELRQEREVLSERYLERHPRMLENERSIAAVETRLQKTLRRGITDLQSRLNTAREREASLAAELQQAERESLELDRVTIQYEVMRRTADGARRTHERISDRLHETSITSQLEQTNVRIVDRATVSGSPVEPDIIKVAMLVAALGGFFFVGAPIGLGVLDRRLKAASDVEHFLGQRLVGEITTVRRVKRKNRAHVVEKDLDDSVAEAFRGILSQLQLSSAAGYPKTLLATSTIPGEGKSFLVSNLGFCFAAHGKRTLMVDLDLRRPSLHRFYDSSNEFGFLRWLNAGSPGKDDLVSEKTLGIKEVAPNLFLLRAGGSTKKATETINHPATGELIAALRNAFDVVLIDTPPLGIFPDALALGSLVDESLYVVRFGKVDRQQVRNFLGKLEEANAGLMGAVMNGMPKGARYSHYYSGYGYGNYKYAKYYAKQR